MGKMNNDGTSEDDEIIILSSDSDSEETPSRTDAAPAPTNTSTKSKRVTPTLPTVPMRADVKVEKDAEETDVQMRENNANNASSSINPVAAVQQRTPINEQPDFPSGFPFDAMALFGPENASLPIEERLASFINNVQSLTSEKLKLENAERQAKRQSEQAATQLATANQEISKLKDNLVQSQSKICQQTDSITELQNVVEKLKRQENWSKSKIKSITGTLMNLQAKMVQILEDTEVDGATTMLSTAESQAGTTTRQRAAALSMNSDAGSGTLAEVILKENIENFEKDFQTKFSQIEEQDSEIKNELLRTNEMLQRIQASLMEQFQAESYPVVSSSPQLTYESMEDQDMGDEQFDPIPGSSGGTSNVGSSGHNGLTKKVSQQEDSKPNNKNILHARDPMRTNACICGVRYGTKFSLNRHLRMESGRNHFSCNICTASYFELCHLRKHYESAHQLHYPSKVAGCTACGKVFNSFEVFRKHRKRCTGKQGHSSPDALTST